MALTHWLDIAALITDRWDHLPKLLYISIIILFKVTVGSVQIKRCMLTHSEDYPSVNINDLILIQLRQRGVNSPHHSSPPVCILFSSTIISPAASCHSTSSFSSTFLSSSSSSSCRSDSETAAILSTVQER